MKWDNPTHGQVKKVKRFAFLPVSIENGRRKIWLESYIETFTYVELFDYDNNDYSGYWKVDSRERKAAKNDKK
jgi:hypothetical protein